MTDPKPLLGTAAVLANIEHAAYKVHDLQEQLTKARMELLHWHIELERRDSSALVAD
jgi:hypothetical protein